MKMKFFFKRVFLTVMTLIACVAILWLGFWLIDGRSPQAYLVAHALPKTTMEAYEKGKGDMTDKSIVEIPEGVEFPREVKQFKVGDMQVFECPAEDNSKPIVLYIHGGAYVNNFTSRHWSAMAEWAETTGCGIVTPNYPLFPLYCQGCPSVDASALQTAARTISRQAHYDYGRFCRRRFQSGSNTGTEG